ncbi:MAG: LPS export ABC transporter permease LptG [Gammaproteobacteria bacterium]|nr:LPS export ABC transporter permease LptG [Gammaproteobacteria bacterium]
MRVDRYIIRSVLELTVLVALVLLVVYTLAAFIADLGNTGRGGLSIAGLAEHTALLTPSTLYLLMPVIALVGTLLGLGALARCGELTAMRTAGVSMARVGLAVLGAGALLGAVSFALGDWIGPAGEHAAAALRAESSDTPGQALWLRDADSVVRIGRLDAEDHIADVTVFRLRADGTLADGLYAVDGRYRQGVWRLRQVRETRFDGDVVDAGSMPVLDWRSGVTPQVLRLFILEENSLSTVGLLRLIAYLDDNHLDAQKYRLLLWRKLFEPLTVMVMALLAVPFVSGSLRGASAGQRLLLGLLVGLVFYVVNKVSVSFGAIYDYSPVLAAGAPTALLALAAVWQLRRNR